MRQIVDKLEINYFEAFIKTVIPPFQNSKNLRLQDDKFTQVMEQGLSQQSITVDNSKISDLQTFLPTIGVLRINWYNDEGKLTYFNYGSAFAINNKMIMTCMHNIFSSQSKTMASQVIFIPNVSKGYLSRYQQYSSGNQTQFKCKKPQKPLYYKPLQQELAILMLDDGQQIKSDYFLKIGSLQQGYYEQNYSKKEVFTVGYPSRQYSNKINLQDAYVTREQFNGKLHSIDNHIINHTMKTSIGQSGSPIITRDHNGYLYAIGIHTHRGAFPEFNSGLYFNEKIIKKTEEYECDLYLNFCPNNKIQRIFKSGLNLNCMLITKFEDDNMIESLTCGQVYRILIDQFNSVINIIDLESQDNQLKSEDKDQIDLQMKINKPIKANFTNDNFHSSSHYCEISQLAQPCEFKGSILSYCDQIKPRHKLSYDQNQHNVSLMSTYDGYEKSNYYKETIKI